MNKPLLVLCLLILCALAGYSQNCTLNVTISSSAANICSGSKVTLTAVQTGGTGPYTYLWNTGENTPSIDVNRAGSYTVTVTDKTPGCQPVTASTDVTAVNTPNPPSVQGQRVCPGSTATLTATAPGGTYQWYDADGKFLFTGNPYVTAPITEATVFYVETTIGGCTSFRSPVIVNVTGRPNIQADPVCSGGPVTLIASGADSYAWYADATGAGTPLSTSSTYQTPSLTQTTPYYLVVVIGECTSAPIQVNARVIPPPSAPKVTGPGSVCAGSSLTLSADGDGIVEWYDVPSGGTPLISSPDYTTPVLNTSKTYYVQSTVGNCVSPRTMVQVNVTPLPEPPPSQSSSTCYGTSTTLIADANPTGSYTWYTAAVGGTVVSNSNSFLTPVLTNTTTYYVQHSNGGCTSELTPIVVSITPQSSAPVVSDGPTICNGAQATLTATSAQNGTIQWFTAESGGTAVFTGSPFVTPVLTNTTTYYVQFNDAGGCMSERIPVTVTVLDAVTKPTVVKTPVCAGTSVTLTATGSPEDYRWYDQPTGGNLLVLGDTYVTPELSSTTTYYVESIFGDCESGRTAVTVTVNPLPVAPNINGPTTICPGESAVLSSAASGVVQWFNVATGGTPLFTGSSYTTPPLFNQTTYYAEVSNGTCTSSRTALTVSITQVLNPQFQYPSGTVCTSGSNVKPVIYNPAGGTFTSSPAGLVFVDNTTGEINVAASIPNTYAVIFTFGGTCAGANSQKIAIVTIPDARFTYNGPFCQSGSNPFPTFNAGASAGVFSSSPAGLVFKNTSTGEIDLDKSSAGTYQVTNTIAASAGCPASTYTTQVKINAKVIVDAGPAQPVLQGTTVQLAGSIRGGVTTGKWTGGAGSFSSISNPKAVYTPAPGETQVTLTLTSDIPTSPCGPVSDKVTITISPVPPEPTVDVKQVCVGSTTTLVAKAPGGTYRWYDAATGGTLLYTGAIFTTPPITADITYYVSVTKGGITSARKAVLVTANQQPAPPEVAVPAAICQGSAVTLVARGSTGTYRWYDLPIGGSMLKQGDTFTSGVLTTNRTYYVETTVNGCTSDRKKVDVPVTPLPHVIGAGPDPVCSGSALNYTITADRTDASFSWSRAAVNGISNPAVTGETTNTITETLINTTGNAIDVTYVITALNGTCPGPAVSYVVTVNPTPTVTSQPPPPICNGSSTNYAVTFNTPATGTSFNWSRDVVPGISNAAVSGQASATIKEILFNTTIAPIEVTYVFNAKTASCQAQPYQLKVTVNPEVQITSASSGTPVCSNTPLGYTIQSNIPSATFLWSRAAVAGITNPAVSNQTDAIINESLVNTAPFSVRATYTITPFAYGCAGKAFTYSVLVIPQVLKPDGRSNSPVCEGQDIHLLTPAIPGASYLWTGPNNYQSESQSPTIPKATLANAGIYKLYFKVNGCLSEASEVPVVVNPTPVVNAGPNETYCKTIPVIQLKGEIPTGGTGIWSGGRNGKISRVDDLKATYIPSQADIDAGSVTLKLTSTGYCDPVSSLVTFTFAPSPGADAGPATINGVCNQNPMVPLSGASVVPGTTPHWSSASGKGRFIPSADMLNPTFEPDPTDVAKGFVKVTLTAVGVDECHTPTDDVTINFVPPPTVQADAAGDTRYVLKEHTITLNPVVSDENVTYLWTPATGLSDNTIKNPFVVGIEDITYKLTITKTSNGCPNYSFVNVKVSPNISVKNTFTPNGDGANDYWEITGLVAYEDVTVDVFNRYGKQIFHSLGYPKPWDGTNNGGAVPSGTYYYVINSKQQKLRLSGYVVILK